MQRRVGTGAPWACCRAWILPSPSPNRTGKFPCIRLSTKCLVSSVCRAVAEAAEGDQVVDGGGRHRADVVHLEACPAAAALAAKAVAQLAPELELGEAQGFARPARRPDGCGEQRLSLAGW